MSNLKGIILYGDQLYPLAFSLHEDDIHYTPVPAACKIPRPAALSDNKKSVRVALRRIVCGERVTVLGVSVERTHNGAKQWYYVNGNAPSLPFEAAVAAVVRSAEGGKA